MPIYWGVIPYMVRHMENTDQLVNEVESALVRSGYAKLGDRIVIVASLPPSISGKTNFMKIHEIGG